MYFFHVHIFNVCESVCVCVCTCACSALYVTYDRVYDFIYKIRKSLTNWKTKLWAFNCLKKKTHFSKIYVAGRKDIKQKQKKTKTNKQGKKIKKANKNLYIRQYFIIIGH